MRVGLSSLLSTALEHGRAYTSGNKWVAKRFRDNVYVYHGPLCLFVYYSANNCVEWITAPSDQPTARAVEKIRTAVGADFGTRP